eukprot:TRINITY_DN16936_c0_g1_i1.p1 TRINITY_DN16936_c0_g1~~TRINITY_DN16936_c0_g1_i1.p1  ORF type:complete len:577 (-),score=152.90 TRINITY_DN16936_c0_g1_i1:64-1560(-)
MEALTLKNREAGYAPAQAILAQITYPPGSVPATAAGAAAPAIPAAPPAPAAVAAPLPTISMASISGSSVIHSSAQLIADLEQIDSETDIKAKKSKISTILTNFLRKRPATNDQVVSRLLPEPPAIKLVPANFTLIKKVCDWLASNALDMEGIFRVSGSVNDVKLMCDEFVRGEAPWINQPASETLSPHTVASALKLYFRERTLPVIPFRLCKKYLDDIRGNPSDETTHLTAIKSLLRDVPNDSRSSIMYLFKLLSDLPKYEEQNKMNRFNLSVVWGPTIMKAQAMQSAEVFAECESQIQFVSIFIKNYDMLTHLDLGPCSKPPEPCPWFLADITVPEAQVALASAPPGTFLLTFCPVQQVANYTAVCVAKAGGVQTFNVAPSGEAWKTDVPGDTAVFTTVAQLVQAREHAGDFVKAYVRPKAAAPRQAPRQGGLDLSEYVTILLSGDALPSNKRAAALEIAKSQARDHAKFTAYFGGNGQERLPQVILAMGNVLAGTA